MKINVPTERHERYLEYMRTACETQRLSLVGASIREIFASLFKAMEEKE